MRIFIRIVPSFLLIAFIIGFFLPLYFALVAASHDGISMMQSPVPMLPGKLFYVHLKTVFQHGLSMINGIPLSSLLWNSFIMALLIAIAKVWIALCSAFSLVYFDFPFKKTCFAFIFLTMMLPIEVRIIPTFEVIVLFGWLNSFAGLSVPLMASATATFLFRQFFKTIPGELMNAATIDGAGPWRFFWDILLPLSKSHLASLFIIMFVYGWNQYLWPLIITTETKKATLVMGIRYLSGVADQVPQWQYIMTVAWVALLPPCLIVVSLLRWFEKGLCE